MAGKLLWGWDSTNSVWIPVLVDSSGRIKADLSNVNLNDLADVSVPAPADGDFFYYDDATGLWKSKAHADLTTGVHGVGAHGILDVTRSALTYYVDAGSGDDDNDGSQDHPKATILGALNALPVVISYGPTIKVRPGNYPENNAMLTLDRFNTLDYITIESVNDDDEAMYDNGLATGGGNNYLDDSGGGWSTDQFNGAYIWIYAGTGAGQIRTISDTTSTRITVSVNWTVNPDATSYYAIGGGATLTGTDIRHIYVDGKKLKLYGFRHTGATESDVCAFRYPMLYVENNYFASSVTGFRVEYLGFGQGFYNYSLASSYGFLVGLIANAFIRANVIKGAGKGVRAYRKCVVNMHPNANMRNYFDSCTTGIYMEGDSGCVDASSQAFNLCGTDIDPAVSTTVPRWWD